MPQLDAPGITQRGELVAADGDAFAATRRARRFSIRWMVRSPSPRGPTSVLYTAPFVVSARRVCCETRAWLAGFRGERGGAGEFRVNEGLLNISPGHANHD